MKIAWFTPFTKKSAIGQYSSIIVQQLSKSAEVVVYVSDIAKGDDNWLPEFKQVSMAALSLPELLASLDTFDMVIYNFGDNYLLHGNIYQVFRQRPGIVILHDLVMHHFFSGYYFNDEKNPEAYIEELGFAHGEAGRELGTQVVAGEAGNIWEDATMLKYHMAKSALRGCYGAVTHSRFAMRAIEEFAAYPVTQINFPRPNLSYIGASKEPPDGKTRFLSFGVLNRNKMVTEVITLIGEHPTLRERIVYNVIGQGLGDYTRELEQLIEQFNLAGTVNLLGYQTDPVLRDFIRETDVIVNLRNPHFGESSWVLLEAAFSAKPTIVWKHGYYDEFPDDTVAKVTEDNLVATLEALASDKLLRQSLSERIARYANDTFITEQYCQRLLAFIGTVRRSRPLLELTDSFARKIAENDPTNQTLAQLVAKELAVFL